MLLGQSLGQGINTCYVGLLVHRGAKLSHVLCDDTSIYLVVNLPCQYVVIYDHLSSHHDVNFISL